MAASLACCAGSSSARELKVTGAPMKGFARIELRFDEMAKVRVRASNGVIVLAFDAPAHVTAEKLAAEIGSYVSAVRRDPDGTGMRLALVAPVRTNLLEAGERVFLDLLPPSWSGLPPALPPDVVAELAERARVAEAKVKAEAERRQAARQPVTLRLAELPSLTRLVFEPPPGTRARWTTLDGATELVFDGLLSLDLAGSRPKGASGIAEFTSSAETNALRVKVATAPGYAPHGFREADTLVLDLAKPQPAPAPPAPTAVSPSPPKTDDRSEPPVRQASVAETPVPAAPIAVPVPPVSAAAPPPAAEPPAASGPLRPVGARDGEGGSILFPFRTGTPAAAFARGGRLTLLFDTLDRLDPAALASAARGLAEVADVRSESGVVQVRLVPAEGRPVRLLPEGTGWRLWVGGQPGLPPDDTRVSRAVDASGNTEIAVGLASAAAVRWTDEEGGARLAVVTASGRPQAMTNPRHFVEFGLPASLQGIVVEARADDISVALGRGGILISRTSGLSLSPVGSSGEARGPAPPVLNREAWIQDGAGSANERYRDLVAEAADAPRSGRAEIRFRLARFLLANGLSLEAASVLALARAEDAAFAGRRESVLLSAIASIRAERLREARGFLAHKTLADDPEAALWRAALDAREREWTRALSGFRRSAEMLAIYPEDLSGWLRLLALRAALETGDVASAETAMAGIDRLPAGSVGRDEHELARARVDEAAGRREAALKSYDRLAEEAARPAAAEALLRGTALAVRLDRLPAAEATPRLELLSVAWRGDEVELGTLVELARLYAAEGRWRDMFATTQRANRSFPNHELTRTLYDDTARRFEGLLLGETPVKLSAVDILALYYDFKELAPIGRRGDEIVRRLADQLVELDLLDQAADLLQHQVDKRLTGAARAAVAARLAAIRLMSGKPALALAALHATRLAELPASVRKFRLLLEAKAEADQTRTDLALEIVEGESGVDFARLRAGILFGARRWREAGDASEGLVGRRGEGADPLSERDRSDVIRAAVAHALAEEPVALDRLRSKFVAKMADSPDAKTFEFLLQPGAARARDFRAVMRDVGKADSLRRLLTDWSGAIAPPDGLPAAEAVQAGRRAG
ncbi:hypothetical protein [uncultured Enterovirga sp.]|uniref:hypothetical protein n=1 Tax=uncultured Enterovirga sp. TaxID=2026352 RepID=UPI0035CA1278